MCLKDFIVSVLLATALTCLTMLPAASYLEIDYHYLVAIAVAAIILLVICAVNFKRD